MDAQGWKDAAVHRHDQLRGDTHGGGEHETRLEGLHPETAYRRQTRAPCPCHTERTGETQTTARANIHPARGGISGNQAAHTPCRTHTDERADIRRERHGQGAYRTAHSHPKQTYGQADCGSLSPTLAQSAFFGHRKGAFTGADSDKTGYFEEADDGTLFLDEVGNLSLETQQMLLRAIQERRYRPIGAKEDKTANVRIVAATNEDLQKAVSEKRFRQDLLYRLREFVITVPPLRDCQEDIMPLAEFFRETANQELERDIKGFNASARNALLTYPWPGNVRELKQVILAAVLQTEDDTITAEDLELVGEQTSSPAGFTLRNEKEEKERILRALKQAKGNKKLAAKMLGIGRSTLYNKLDEYGLNEEN